MNGGPTSPGAPSFRFNKNNHVLISTYLYTTTFGIFQIENKLLNFNEYADIRLLVHLLLLVVMGIIRSELVAVFYLV